MLIILQKEIVLKRYGLLPFFPAPLCFFLSYGLGNLGFKGFTLLQGFGGTNTVFICLVELHDEPVYNHVAVQISIILQVM